MPEAPCIQRRARDRGAGDPIQEVAGHQWPGCIRPTFDICTRGQNTAVRLRRSKVGGPGYRRIRRGRGFAYIDPHGEPVRDSETLSRIESLVIPPAWRNAWICPFPSGHIQAVGTDAAGRRQYTCGCAQFVCRSPGCDSLRAGRHDRPRAAAGKTSAHTVGASACSQFRCLGWSHRHAGVVTASTQRRQARHCQYLARYSTG